MVSQAGRSPSDPMIILLNDFTLADFIIIFEVYLT